METLKRTFRNLLSLALSAGIIVGLAVVPDRAQAQNSGGGTLLNGGTNNVSSAATNSTQYFTNGCVIDASQIDNVGVEYQFSGVNATTITTNIGFLWLQSLDGTLPYGTNSVIRHSFGNAGGSNQVWVTNISTKAVGYLSFYGIENSGSNAITNITVSWYIKPKKGPL